MSDDGSSPEPRTDAASHRQVRCLVADPGAAQARLVRLDVNDLDVMQAVVGGYVEAIGLSTASGGAVAWVNEEGLISGLAPNPLATRVLLLDPRGAAHLRPGSALVGPVVFTGLSEIPGPLGQACVDVPEELLASCAAARVVVRDQTR